MKRFDRPAIYAMLVIGSVSVAGYAQVADNGGLFSTDEVLSIKLIGDMHELVNDRDDHSKYHPFTLTYKDGENPNSVRVKIRTRGHFRRIKGNCTYPPLLLNFPKKQVASSPVFKGQNKMKLVTPCRGDKYVVQEYLVYKLYNLVSPKSFNARLVSVVYEDSVKGKSTDPMYGVLIEDEDQMAKRNQTVSVERAMRPEQTNTPDFLKMAVFEYLIGNTDWSVQYLQNVKLIAADSMGIPSTVPYDFDHAGIVRAPYARPAEELQLTSTLNRRYRGYCIKDMAQFQATFDLYNQLKEKIYAVYTQCPLLDEKYVKATTKFLDEFYHTINNPKEAGLQFLYPCDPEGTGNVVIKGLSKN